MARLVREISASYQHWAIAAAKLMERAYNFENDNTLVVIRPGKRTGDLLGLPTCCCATWTRSPTTTSRT